MEQNSEYLNEQASEETSGTNNQDTVVLGEKVKGSSDNTAYDDMITIDENGMRWCTVKYASDFLGKSNTTVRRYASEKKFKCKQEKSPNNYGYTYLISVDDLELFKSLLDANEKKSSVNHKDTAFELLSTLNNMDLPAINDLKEKMVDLLEGQMAVGEVLTKIASQNAEFKTSQDSVGEALSDISAQNKEILQHLISENEVLKKENKKLTEQVSDLTTTVDRQRAIINELQSRGFFARIANKPPVTAFGEQPNNGGSLLSTDKTDL